MYRNMSVKKIRRTVNMKGESTVNGGKCTTERTSPWPRTITVTSCCNNDIELISNGSNMKDIMWYLTGYQSKKQGKNFNTSVLMVKSLLYHEMHINHINKIVEWNHLLIFWCQQLINCKMEMSAPQVIAYSDSQNCLNVLHFLIVHWITLEDKHLSTRCWCINWSMYSGLSDSNIIM